MYEIVWVYGGMHADSDLVDYVVLYFAGAHV
jgi:hypothetical protein